MLERLKYWMRRDNLKVLPHRAWQGVRKLRSGFYKLPHQRDLLLETDWNVLIILDACRADYFLELEPEAEVVRSLGRSTHNWVWEFVHVIQPVLNQRILWVTANPVVNVELADYGEENALVTHDVWKTAWKAQGEQGIETVHPRDVNEAVMTYVESYGQPDRMIVHYVQPHGPYIGMHSLGISGGNDFAAAAEGQSLVDAETIESQVATGQLTWGDLRLAYQENLALCYKYARQLVQTLSGSTVVTADHGEVLGESDRFGHKFDYYHLELSRVPWLHLEGEEFDAQPVRLPDSRVNREDDDVVTARLRHLGYA